MQRAAVKGETNGTKAQGTWESKQERLVQGDGRADEEERRVEEEREEDEDEEEEAKNSVRTGGQQRERRERVDAKRAWASGLYKGWHALVERTKMCGGGVSRREHRAFRPCGCALLVARPTNGGRPSDPLPSLSASGHADCSVWLSLLAGSLVWPPIWLSVYLASCLAVCWHHHCGTSPMRVTRTEKKRLTWPWLAASSWPFWALDLISSSHLLSCRLLINGCYKATEPASPSSLAGSMPASTAFLFLSSAFRVFSSF